MKGSEPKSAFRTHANYLRAFSNLVYGGQTDERQEVYCAIWERARGSTLITQRQCQPDSVWQVRKSLENAWGTELLLTLGEHLIRDDELLRLSNNWNVVQSYYVMYHALQSLVVARGNPRPTSHGKTLQLYCEYFTRTGVHLAPWTLGFGSEGPMGIPETVEVSDRIHSWSACDDDNSWSLACKALRTTREIAIPERILKRRKEKRAERKREWVEEELERQRQGKKPRKPPPPCLPRLAEQEKAEVMERTRPYTLMDYIYRLRLRSNYEDSAMFTDGPERAGVSEQVRKDICLLCGSTAFLAEMAVQRIVGERAVAQWADDWIERNRSPVWSGGLIERRSLLHEAAY